MDSNRHWMVVRPSWVNLLESLQQGSIVVHLVEGLGVVHVEMNHAVNDEERLSRSAASSPFPLGLRGDILWIA